MNHNAVLITRKLLISIAARIAKIARFAIVQDTARTPGGIRTGTGHETGEA